ncbi:MAG TPA: APC family permease [Candidatus Angelobacter sp.]|nr:APC family permease [Candidatus Angelobacter sp.]
MKTAVQQQPTLTSQSPKTSKNKNLTLWPLVAATFFMVSGGTYGTEDTVHGAGYAGAILILLITPVLWSLPTAYMIGELASALPEEGGFYVWVRRALGPCWGFQEAWLSLVASIFDMAIYPALFIAYLARLFPYFGIGHRGVLVGLAIVTVCALLNIAGVRLVALTSLWLFVLLTLPFVVLIVFALWKHGMFAGQAVQSTTHVDLIAGILVAMWNYMGWDNASTIAAEVENPQRTYSRAMLITVSIVALSYILPVAAMAVTGIQPSAFVTGSWADLAALIVGPWLRVALVVGGMLSAFGMFNSLVMSYSRLPLAMAQDGLLPAMFAKVHPKSKAPWVAIVTLAVAWSLCLGLNFERLVTIDILIYGLSLLLEFAALAALRLREPDLPRPFRVPGGTFGAFAVGVFPMLLLGFSVVKSQSERIAGMNALSFGCVLIAAGFVIYFLRVSGRSAQQSARSGI